MIDARSMALRDAVELDAGWRFDALSPAGRWLYLIEEPEGVDPARTMFRAYDLRHHRLLPSGELMRGFPMTRATAPRSRWEYTLYAGGVGPFIHALDTVRRASLSLDLPPG